MDNRRAEKVIALFFPDTAFKLKVSIELIDYNGPEDPALSDVCEGALNLFESFINGMARHAVTSGGSHARSQGLDNAAPHKRDAPIQNRDPDK